MVDLLDRVGIEDLDEEQRAVAELIGMENFRLLVRSFSGSSLYIPKIESLEKPIRDAMIREEFNGNNYRELGLKYGLTEAWIRDIVKEKAREIRRKPVDGQISFKGILY